MQQKEPNQKLRNKMEKNYNPEQKNMKTIKQQDMIVKSKSTETPIKKDDSKVEEKSEEKKIEEKEIKKDKKKIERIKKEEAVVNAKNLPISTKFSVSICKFIKGKEIERAIADLEDVLAKRKAVPMKGEYAHKKGKRMSGGKYPKNATEQFIKLVKSLGANSNYNGIENPIIVEAVANKASEPHGRFGRIRRKRTHVTLKAKEKLNKKENRK